MTHPSNPSGSPQGRPPGGGPFPGGPPPGGPQQPGAGPGPYDQSGQSYQPPARYPAQPGGQYGQYPQQPQHSQYPHFPQYGQSDYSGQYGQPGGYGGPPAPKKSRTGLWVSLSAAAVAVVAFLVTGLLAPGFLLSGSVDAGDGAAADVAEDAIEGLIDHDADAVRALTCADTDGDIDSALNEIEVIKDITVTRKIELSGDTATVETRFFLERDGMKKNGEFNVELARAQGSWCLQDLTVVYARLDR